MNDVQVLEEATSEVVANPGMSAKQKVALVTGVVLTAGLVVGGIFLAKRIKAKKAAKSADDASKTEVHK